MSKHTHRQLLLTGAGAATLLAAIPVAVVAQTREPTEAVSVGEVVVTARRREERLRDVPVSASVIDVGQLIERGDIVDPQTVLNSVPGVKFLDTSSPSNSEITLRGSGQGRGTSTEAAVGLYRNNMYVGGGTVGGRSLSRLDLLDLEQFQVLRGPQGALYGRNAVGGAITVTSARPQWNSSGFVNLNYQFETDLKQVQAAMNHAVSDEVAIRLTGEWFDQPNGFFYNASQDNFIDRQKGYAARGQIRFRRENFDANLLVEDGLYDLPTLRASFVVPPGATGFPRGYVTPKYVAFANDGEPAKQRVQSVIGQFTWESDLGTLSGVTGFRRRLTRTENDTDQFDPATLAREQARGNATTVTDANAATNNNDDFEALYADFHFASAKTGRFSWLVGLELLDTDDHFTTVTGRTPTRANPSVGNFLPGRGRYKSWAPYGSIGVDLTDALSVEGETRYSKDRKKRQNFGFTLPTNTPIAAQTSADADSFSNLDYAVSLTYKLPTEWIVYGRLATGYRAGGFNANTGDPRAPIPVVPSYQPENGTSLEVGAKGDLGRNLFITLAAYQTKVEDFQAQIDNGCAVTNPVCPVASVAFISNVGRAEVWGLELTATGRWDLWGGRLRVNVNGSRQGGELKSTGRPIQQNPKWMRAADINYRRPLFGETQGFINLSYSGQTGGFQEIDSLLQLDDRDLFDARLGITFDRVEIAAYANNVGQESYVVFRSATQARYSDPRKFGVQVRYRW
ncbi:MAG: TonB-dependent receptor [Alphaproteobacteria bacterium]